MSSLTTERRPIDGPALRWTALKDTVRRERDEARRKAAGEGEAAAAPRVRAAGSWVSDEDCGTAEMLIAPRPAMAGYDGRAQYVYFRPSEDELEQLRRGAFIEFAQYGQVVQPFSAAIWGAPQ